jgi:dTDP-4-dehydrorhamnose 3,5-epimerase
LIFEPVVHRDQRGLLFECFRREFADRHGLPPFVQENESCSIQHTIRGLHYQLAKPQAKLVRVLSGEIFDVVVDLRRASPTYGQWIGEFLSAENRLQLFVPTGFAHGFCVTSESAQVLYKCSDYYSGAADQLGIAWNDPQLLIKWPTASPVVSDKDAALPQLVHQPPALLPR